jgi:hypothetical protein
VNDVLQLIIVLLALTAFIALPVSVALSRTETSRPDDGVTIPQQRDRRDGEGA